VWPIVGHEWAIELLTESVASGRLRHAYLLVGPGQVGKTALAKAFAQFLLCDATERPCGVCRSCRLVQGDRHPDVWMVAPDGGSIKIEAIREMQHALSLSPVEGNMRICIIARMDLATTSAANCLLKTLEEPSGRALLVLTADRVDALLPTVVSRCQVLTLRLVPTQRIVSALKERGVGDEEARLLGHLARGRIGWAIDAARDPETIDARAQVLDELASLTGGSLVARFAWAEALSKRPEQIPAVLATMTDWWRDVLLVTSGSHAEVTNVDRAGEIARWAARFGPAEASAALRGLRQTAWRLEHNANVRLALEVLALDMPGRT